MGIEQIHSEIVDKVLSLHSKDTVEMVFLSGSAVKGNFTEYSDIDYTACISEAIQHPRFYFTLLDHDGAPRVVSIFFYESVELLRSTEQVDDEFFLWEKEMLRHSRFIFGKEEVYNKLLHFCNELRYTREPKGKTIHKSFGKLLELLVKMKKYFQVNDALLLKYYGQKLAEHVRRLVLEFNGPIYLKGESEYVRRHFEMESPRGFADDYQTLAGLSFTEQIQSAYLATAQRLVTNTITFIREQPSELLDDFSKQLLENKLLDSLIDMQSKT